MAQSATNNVKGKIGWWTPFKHGFRYRPLKKNVVAKRLYKSVAICCWTLIIFSCFADISNFLSYPIKLICFKKNELI